MIFGNNNDECTLRKAELADLDAIKKLVDQHKVELGFVIRGALEKSINSREIIVAIDQHGNLQGFVHYRHRRDEQTTLYNIVVDNKSRGQGIGRALIDVLCAEASELSKTFILLKCPTSLPANEFYRHYGFVNFGIDEGKKRPLSIWRINLASANKNDMAN